MGRIRTKTEGPSQRDLKEVPSSLSLYRRTHFYERKTSEELERRAQLAAIQRSGLSSTRNVRLQSQVGF